MDGLKRFDDEAVAAGGVPGTQRIAASGATAVTANTVTTLTTVTRNANERFNFLLFPERDVLAYSMEWDDDQTVGGDECNMWMDRTGTVDQLRLRCWNENASNASVTVDWILYGIVP